MAITKPPVAPFELGTETEKEIVANALATYIDYLTQIGEGVRDKAEEHIKNIGLDIIGGTMRDTIELRQKLVKHVGYDPTYES